MGKIRESKRTNMSVSAKLSMFFITLSMALSIGCGTLFEDPGAFKLAYGEKCVIAIPAKAIKPEKIAAEQLAEYLKKSMNVSAKIASEDKLSSPDYADIYIGRCEKTEKSGLYKPLMDKEAYYTIVSNGKLYIFGDDENANPWRNSKRAGTLFGVFDFIERRLGVIWIWPGDTGEFTPEKKLVRISPSTNYQKPDFSIRSMGFGYMKYETKKVRKDLRVWYRRMRMGWVDKAWFGHSWYYFAFNRNKPGAIVEKHPEWLALWDGKRRKPHCCTSSKEFRNFMVEKVLENAKKKNNKIVSVSPSDGGGFCECVNCRALDIKGLDYTKLAPNLSNRHWAYANHIAKEVKKRNPEIGVGMFAYTAYAEPPTNIEKMEDNLYVSFTFSQAYFIKPEIKKKYYDRIAKWKKLKANLVAREYWGMHYWMDLPYIFTDQIKSATPFLHEAGMVAMYGETGKNFATQGPNYYLQTHLMWNSKENGDALLDRYYSAFGPAKENIRKYYGIFENSLKDNQKAIKDFSYRELINSWGKLFPQNVIEQAGVALAKAKKNAGASGEFAKRVAVVEVGYEYTKVMIELLELYRKLGRSGVPLWFFGYDGDAAQSKHYKLPDTPMPKEWLEFWKEKPTIKLPESQVIAMLKRAKFLGEERVRILEDNKNMQALSVGLYQMTVDRGIRPWHKIVKEELKKRGIK